MLFGEAMDGKLLRLSGTIKLRLRDEIVHERKETGVWVLDLGWEICFLEGFRFSLSSFFCWYLE